MIVGVTWSSRSRKAKFPAVYIQCLDEKQEKNVGALEGLKAVVTGGASGIGLATALRFISEGADVAVLDISLEGLPSSLSGIVCDITDRASVGRAFDSVQTQFGGLDILVNNAGIGAVGTVEESDDEEWSRVLDVNVVGTARVSAAALPLLRNSTHPAIVNVCSIAASAGLPQRAVYAASKGAIYSLTLAMATDHAPEGIRVNCVNPGTVHTPFVDRNLTKFADPTAELRLLNERQPLGRMVTPEEVADAITYLAGPGAASTTGASLAVDGGMYGLRMRPRA